MMAAKILSIPVIILVLFASSSLFALAEDEDYLFNDWVTEGDTFDVSGLSVLVRGGVETSSAILMFPQKTVVLSEGSCSNVDSLSVCLDDWQYVKGGDVKIHGEDLHEYLIKVKVPGPEIEIERDADNGIMEIGESTKVTIIIRNNGEKAALGLYYSETIPAEFEITNTNKIIQYGNRLEWRGSIPANGAFEMEYGLRSRGSFSGRIDAVLEYASNERRLSKTDSLGLKVTSPLEVSAKLDKNPMDFKEENRVYVTVKNKRSSDADVDVSVRFPASFYIIASHLNATSSTLYEGGGTIEGGDEVTYITRFRADSPGDFIVNISAAGVFPDKTITEHKSVNVSVELKKAELYFVHSDIYAGEEAKVRLYMKNPNAYTELTDVNAKADSPYFNKTAHAAKFNPLEYNELFSTMIKPMEKGRFKMTAEASYTAGGKSYNVAAQEEVNVVERKKEVPAENKTAGNITLPAQNATNISENVTGGPEEETEAVMIIMPDTSMIESLYSYNIVAGPIRRIIDDFGGVLKARSPKQ